MSREKVVIEKDKKGNIIYERDEGGWEFIFKYDENNNEIYYKDFLRNKPNSKFECWKEFIGNKTVYYKDSLGCEKWYRWDGNIQIAISQQEFLSLKREREHKEFLSREKINPFELLDLE